MLAHNALTIPEYPQNPAAHLKSPTTIRITGRTSHCDDELRAGHRNAARGKDGDLTRASGLERGTFSTLSSGFLVLRLGLCGEGLGPAMFTAATDC